MLSPAVLQAAANELMVAEEEQARWQSSIDEVGCLFSSVALFLVLPSDKSQVGVAVVVTAPQWMVVAHPKLG